MTSRISFFLVIAMLSLLLVGIVFASAQKPPRVSSKGTAGSSGKPPTARARTTRRSQEQDEDEKVRPKNSSPTSSRSFEQEERTQQKEDKQKKKQQEAPSAPATTAEQQAQRQRRSEQNENVESRRKIEREQEEPPKKQYRDESDERLVRQKQQREREEVQTRRKILEEKQKSQQQKQEKKKEKVKLEDDDESKKNEKKKQQESSPSQSSSEKTHQPDPVTFPVHKQSYEPHEIADQTPASDKLPIDDKKTALEHIAKKSEEKRIYEKQSEPMGEQYIMLHGRRVSMTSLKRMCKALKVDHKPFLLAKSERELELGILFASNRVSSVFDLHVHEKRLQHTDNVSCSHGIQIAQSKEAERLSDLLNEALREIEMTRLHLLDLADSWTLTQTKDSDLVEEVVSSLGYFQILGRVGNDFNQRFHFLRSPGSIDGKNGMENQKRCDGMVKGLLLAANSIPEAVPNWTHLKVGVDMLLQQCNSEPGLRNYEGGEEGDL